MAISLGQLIVRMGLDASDFISGMTRSQAQAQRFSANLSNQVAAGVIKAEIAMKALGAAASFAIRAFPQLVEQGAKMQDLAEKVGDAADRFASLSVSAKIGGVDMEAVAAASVKLTKNLVGVDDEGKAAGAALKALGLNIADFKKLAPSDQIEAIAKALEGFAEGPAKAAVAMALFGKAGADMLPFLKELGGGIGRVNILTADQIKLADDFADRQAKSSAILNLYARQVAIEMVPALDAMSGALIDVAKEILGVGKSADDLKKNGSITEWALSVVEDIADIAEVIEDVTRRFNAFIHVAAAGSAKASANKTVLAIGPGMGGRAVNLKPNPEGTAAIDTALQDDLDRIFNKSRLSDKLRNRIAEQRRRLDPEFRKEEERMARAAEQSTGGDKRTLKFDGVDENAGAVLKAKLDGQLKAIREFAEEQKQAYEFANQYLKGVYDDGLTSLSDFFEKQRALRDAGLQVQLQAFDKEVSALEAFKSKALKPQERLDAENKIADAVAKRGAAVQKAGQDAMLSAQLEAREVKQLADRYNDLRATILGLQGDTAGAARIRIDRQVEEARKLAIQSGQDPAVAERLRDLLTLGEQRNQVQTEYGRLVESARIQEEGAMLAAKLGGTSELETLKAIGSIRNGALVQMKALADEAERVALALGTPEARLFADNLALGLAKARAEADPLFQKIRDIGGEIGSTIASNLEDALVHAKSLNEAFKSIAQTVARIIFRESFTKPLEQGLSGMFGGNGTASGGGGVIGAITSFFGDMFAGARATGGPVDSGKMYRVNERAPELLDVNGQQFLMMGNQRGRVKPMGGAAGGQTIVVQVQMPQGATRQTGQQFGAAIAQQLSRASTRNG